MSSFKWEIEDATDEQTPVVGSGEVEIADLKVVSAQGWAVKESDKSLDIPSVQGGAVGDVDSSKKEDNASNATHGLGSLNLGRSFNQTVIIIIVALFGLGFLAVVVNNVWHGKLDFQTYMVSIISFLAGMGIGNFRNPSS